MRNQRASCIQTEAQYVFVVATVLEYIKAGESLPQWTPSGRLLTENKPSLLFFKLPFSEVEHLTFRHFKQAPRVPDETVTAHTFCSRNRHFRRPELPTTGWHGCPRDLIRGLLSNKMMAACVSSLFSTPQTISHRFFLTGPQCATDHHTTTLLHIHSSRPHFKPFIMATINVIWITDTARLSAVEKYLMTD